MRYLLDANIVSDLIRNPSGLVMERIRDVGEARVCTSIIVAAELRHGAEKRGSPRLKAQVEAVLDRLEILPFKAPADAVYGVLRSSLETAGQPIGKQRPADRRPHGHPRLRACHGERARVRQDRGSSLRELAATPAAVDPPAGS